MITALSLATVAFAWLAISTRPGVSYIVLLPALALMGAGLPLFWAPIANTSLGAAQPQEQGQASETSIAIRELAIVLGIALLASTFVRTRPHLTHQLPVRLHARHVARRRPHPAPASSSRSRCRCHRARARTDAASPPGSPDSVAATPTRGAHGGKAQPCHPIFRCATTPSLAGDRPVTPQQVRARLAELPDGAVRTMGPASGCCPAPDAPGRADGHVRRPRAAPDRLSRPPRHPPGPLRARRWNGRRRPRQSGGAERPAAAAPRPRGRESGGSRHRNGPRRETGAEPQGTRARRPPRATPTPRRASTRVRRGPRALRPAPVPLAHHPRRRSRRDPVVDHHRRAPLQHQPRTVAPEAHRPVFDLRAFPPLHLGELDRAEMQPGCYALVHHQRSALANSAHGQLRLERHSELADDDHVQRRVQHPGHLGRNSHPTPR